MTVAVASRPGRLELPLVRWSNGEDDFLCRHYQTMAMPELRKHLSHRTKSAIVQRAGVLNLWGNKNVESSIPWSDEELAVLSMYYPDNGLDLCRAFIPERSKNAVEMMVRRMRLRRKGGPRSNQISAQEWAFVVENVERLGFVVCAEKTGDTPDNLRDKCSRKGIDCDAIDLAFNVKDFRLGDFSESEIEYITRHFPYQGGVRVALALGRAPKTLINFAKRRLGLKTRTRTRTLFPDFSVINPVSSPAREIAS